MSVIRRRWWQVGRISAQHDVPGLGEAIRTPVPAGSPHLVAVVSAQGKTGKSTTVVGLGAVLASERDDQIIAVDANDGMLGRFAPALNTQVTLRDLAARLAEGGFDIREFTSRAPSGLEILAGAAATTAPSEPLDGVSYSTLLTALNLYGVVLTDCATGADGLTTFVALTGADQQVFVSSLSESSIAATARALATYRYLADHTHVVLTGVRDRDTMLDARDAAEHLGGYCRSVVIVPFDERLADPGRVDLESMQEATRDAYRELAAAVAEGFSQTKRQHPGSQGADSRAGPSAPDLGAGSFPSAGVPGGGARLPGRDQLSAGQAPQAALPSPDGGRTELGGGNPPPSVPRRSYEHAEPPVPRDAPRGHEQKVPAATSEMPAIPRLDAPEGPEAISEFPRQDFNAPRPGANTFQNSGQFPHPGTNGQQGTGQFAAPWAFDASPTGQFATPGYDNDSTGSHNLPGRQKPAHTGQFERPQPNGNGDDADDSGGPRPPAPQRPTRQGPEALPPATGPGDGRTPLYDMLETNWFHGQQAEQQSDGSTPALQPQAPAAPQHPTGAVGSTSPNDDLVRPAERVRESAAGVVTTSGLPRRVPKANLSPGTARQQQQQTGPQVSRAPDDIRGRLTNLRRGIAQRQNAATDVNDQGLPALAEARQSTEDDVFDSAGSGSERPGNELESLPRPNPSISPGAPSSAPHGLPSYGGQQQNSPAMPQPMALVRPQRPSPMGQKPSPMRGFLIDEDDDELAPTAPTTGADALSEPHHLIAELAEQAAPDREVPLHVQITREPGQGQGSVVIRSFHVPKEGAQLTITVTAQGLRALGDLTQELMVYPGRDSDVLYFGLRTMASGLHHVTVRAFHKGTYLGAVHLQISVTEGGVTRDGPLRRAVLPGIAFEPGEATLQVHRAEDGSFSFQLLSETCYPPELFRYRGGDPGEATEQIYDQLREAASRAGRASPSDAAGLRKRLKNEGVQLWSSAVPEAIQRQFWEQADRITSFTVLGEHDFVPWELLYPLDADHDNGFLAEWLPVVRRVFRQDRVHQINLPGAAFVMPPGSPAEAQLEINELRDLLGPEVANAGDFTNREALTSLIEGGHAGLLHFACHNAFSRSGSRVHMADGHFTPRDLATAAQTRSLRAHQPLVFFNACRSAGEIPWFSDTLGWAQKFLTAGAGAFIGTLWPVRSDSAMQFAKTFYGQLLDAGQPLGQASLAARQAIRDLDGDPTWLAYAVYGSPAATAATRGVS